MAEKVKVLIVDDLKLAHKMLQSMIETDPEIEVVAHAYNGQEGIELTQKHKPHVILMDIHMPIMDGLQATRHIMQHFPTPILITSSSWAISETNALFEALRAGALEVMEKPDGSAFTKLEEVSDDYVRKIKRFSRVKVIRHISNMGASIPSKPFFPPLPSKALPTAVKTTPSLPQNAPLPRKENPSMPAVPSPKRVLALGASTGGPQALADLLGEFPKNFPIPIVLVQHISANFTGPFVQWLGNSISLSVKEVEEGEFLRAGTVYVGPSLKHFTLDASLRPVFRKEPSSVFHIPSIDVLFQSLSDHLARYTIAVLLTGMGKDGAYGLLEIARKGGTVFAQDEGSSVVFGMPKAAIEMGATDQGFKPKEIADKILALLSIKKS